MMDEQKIRKNISGAIKEVAPNARIFLFGSRARGDASPNSDWDILVVIDEHNVKTLESIIRDRIFDLELKYEQVFSLFVFSYQEWHHRQNITPFYHRVQKEAVSL